jgi:hypothetical protein
MSADLVVVVPSDQVSSMLQAGFKSGGRANQYTSTLVKTYPDAKEAMQVGYRLPNSKGFVWAIEQAGHRLG